MAVLRYDFHSHPKIAALPLASVGLFTKLLSYCSANLTDGFVPAAIAHQMDPKRRHIGRLIDAELIEPVGHLAAKWRTNGGQTSNSEHGQTANGYSVRGYLDHNPARAEVEEKREEARARMRRVRAAKRPKRSREHEANVRGVVRDIGKDKNKTLELRDVTSTEDAPSNVIEFRGDWNGHTPPTADTLANYYLGRQA